MNNWGQMCVFVGVCGWGDFVSFHSWFSDPLKKVESHLRESFKDEITDWERKKGRGVHTCLPNFQMTFIKQNKSTNVSLNHPLFSCTCSIIADLGSKLSIEKSVIKDGLTNPEYDEHARISWKYGCSSKCV